MKKSNTHRNLPLLLLKTREQLMQRFRPILKEYDLSEQQWRILRALSENGELEPREICHLCHISSPSLAGVLKRMSELDLIIKHTVPTDLRRLIIRLTQKSILIVKDISEKNEIHYQQIEDLIGKEIIDSLYQDIDIILLKLAPDT